MSTHYIDPARANEPYYLPTLWVTRFGPFTAKPSEEDDTYTNNDDADDARDCYRHDVKVWTHEARECPCDHADGGDLDDHGPDCAGWYACFCIPGCLPDSSWHGPFATEEEAVAKGRAFFGED